MRLKCSKAALAATLVCGLGSVAMAGDADLAQLKQEMAQLRQSNQQLQAQVGALQGSQNESWLNERRAEEVKTLVREVLADADTRASMADGGMTAGYNKGFFLASEDGKFLLKVGGQVQFRYILNLRDDSGDDDFEGGFQLRRTKLKFEGHIGSPKIGYSVVLANHRSDSNTYLEEAKLSYKIADGLTIEGGRFKSPFLREELTSSSRQLTVERSLFNETFTAGFTEGVNLKWEPTDNVRISAMVNDGYREGEDGGAKDFHQDNTDVAFASRVDIKLAGDWKQYSDMSAWSGEDFAAFIGAAVQVDFDESRTTSGYHYDFNYTVDGSIETNGLGIFAALSGWHFDGDDNTADSTAQGAMIQAGYMVVPDKFEPFVRLEYMRFNDDDETKLVTFGANWYLKKHDAKFTVDVVWALDPIGGSSGLGLLGDAADEDDQVAIRGQFQLLF